MKKNENDRNIIDDLEERADYLLEDELKSVTATSDFFNSIHKALISKGIKLIAGPRGSGKTHLMRYTYMECKNQKKLPLCLYVSFNRYLRLEPLLKTKPNAIELFHVWVLAGILLSITELILSLDPTPEETLIKKLVGFDVSELENAISLLERGFPTELILDRDVSLLKTIEAIENTAMHYGRKRSIILFDDAALTLTPEYMQELFEMIRSIKSASISPKASVYPGTTEYGPRFHVNHEAEMLSVWLPVTSSEYSSVMGDIATNRAKNIDSIPADVVEIIKYASFGIPRAFLVMLRDFKRKEFKTNQQGVNQIIQSHNKWRKTEYKSLALKVPKFQSMIEIGDKLLSKIVLDLKTANSDLAPKKEVQLTVGFSGVEKALEKRMLSLLVEAGMLYEHSSVSHGEDRQYLRYTPHISILIEQKVFPGGSIKSVVDFLNRKPSKHALRRSIARLLGEKIAGQLKINISPCSNCDTPRISESQKFCHNCGAALLDESTFSRCMELNLRDVSKLTDWQKRKVDELKINSIGDFLSLQDPGTELRKIHQIGKKRASYIIDGVDDYVDEFLS